MFILVGLLLYHIRGRLNASEQRIDTLYEMTNKLSNEISATRVYIANLKYAGEGGSCHIENMVPFQPCAGAGSAAGGAHILAVKKIVVSDDEGEDYDDEDGGVDNEDDDDADTDEDDDGDDDNESNATSDIIEVIDIDADAEVEPDIDIDISDLPTDEPVPVSEEIEPMVTMEIVPDSDEDDHSNVETDYSKMNLPTLKKLAAERGIASAHDLSNMKKKEIISMLRGESA